MFESRRRQSALVFGIIVLSCSGAWICGELLKRHADLWGSQSATGLFARVCGAVGGDEFGCNGKSMGKWSTITFPLPVPSTDLSLHIRQVVVPVAFLGTAYFLFMAVWFAFIGPPRRFGPPVHRLPVVIGACGVCASAVCLTVMALGFAPLCIWCLAVHGINLLMFPMLWCLCVRRSALSAGDGSHASASEANRVASQTLTSREAWGAVTFALILVAGMWIYRGERIQIQGQLQKQMQYKQLVNSLQDNREFLLNAYLAAPRVDIPSGNGDLAEDNEPRLVVFTDFECPGCYCNMLAVQNQILKAFNGRLSLSIRHFPLDGTCNESVETEIHPNACDAAYAAEAARVLGGDVAFWKAHDFLFRNRKNLSDTLYGKLALELGLEPRRFASTMKSDAVRDVIAEDTELGARLQVSATPTMFLNGRRLNGLMRGPVFWKAVADASSESQPEDSRVADRVDSAEDPKHASLR